MATTYRPKISGFSDFLQFHVNGLPFYMYRGCLYAGYDLLIPAENRYHFTGPEVKQEIESAIAQNAYFFDVEKSSAFYWPNTNMFSAPCTVEHLCGEICTIKEKYQKQWRL